MLGHSGATIEKVGHGLIRKAGPGVELQASYCKILGEKICPRVFETDEDSYIMERLQEIPVWDLKDTEPMQIYLIEQVLALLEKNAWNTTPVRYVHLLPPWHEELIDWAVSNRFHWISEEFINKLYLEPGMPESVMIHGDPTLANTLLRQDNVFAKVVLIDPILPQGKIPSFVDVDRGKLLQSCLGWEHMLDPRWGDGGPVMWETVLSGLSELERTRAIFWVMVHCSRIIPYAKVDAVRQWAYVHALRMRNVIRLRLRRHAS